jgi:hypothetical protein
MLPRPVLLILDPLVPLHAIKETQAGEIAGISAIFAFFNAKAAQPELDAYGHPEQIAAPTIVRRVIKQ